MSRLPTVAIVGRPNTGKSTLFNRLIGRRKSIENEVAGTTRDQVAHRVETDELDYLLIDTGGMGGGTEDVDFEKDVEMQSLLALTHADLIILTISAKEDLTSSDFAVVEHLRKKRKKHVPVIMVLTKCDTAKDIDAVLPQYYELGISDRIIPTSAAHNQGSDDVRSAVVEHLLALHFKKEITEADTGRARIAIIGKPNVGKSSLVNAFMSDPQREASPLLVSDIPGTTRDATDTLIKYHGKEYVFVDTAGIRRRASTDRGIETFAMMRSIQAIENSDITVLVLDGGDAVSRQDKRIAGLAIEAGKGFVIIVNKMDLLKGDKRKEKMAEIQTAFPFCRYAPVLPVSAKNRDGLLKIFDVLEMVQRNRTRRIPTKELHRWFADATYGKPLGPIAKTKHITQAEEVPPTFVLFVRNTKDVELSQLRYVENRLRENFDFSGTPVRWITRSN